MKIKFMLLSILLILLPSFAVTAYAFSLPKIKTSSPVSYTAPLGTESNPYLINSIEEYNSLINLYKNSSDVFLKLNSNLTETSSNQLTRFSFNGNFNGNNKTITYLNSPLFTQIGGKVSNLNFVLTSPSCTEASFGVLCNELNGTLINCVNNSTITLTLPTSTTCFGGFAGRNSSTSSIINCTNNANMEITVSSGIRVGGFLGEANSPITMYNNINSGNITVSSSASSASIYAGGFIGYGSYKSTDSTSITYNMEKLSNLANIFVSATATSNATYCRIGGIIGGATNNTITSISECTSSGTLSATNATAYTNRGNHIGGIIGYIYGAESNFAKITINNCFTTSSINSTTTSKGFSTLGGLIGYTYSSSNNTSVKVNINNSYSTSSITTTESNSTSSTTIGGLIGQSAKTNISNCFSNVLVYSKDQSVKIIGGLIGYYFNDSSSPSNPTITNCISNTKSTYRKSTSNYIGGLIGYVNGTTSNFETSIITSTYLISSYDSNYNSNYCVYAIGNNTSILLSIGAEIKNESMHNQQSPFYASWDFSNIWIFTDSLPTLKYLIWEKFSLKLAFNII